MSPAVEMLWTFVEKAVIGVFDALGNFGLDLWQAVSLDLLLSGPAIFTVLGARWLAAFDTFASRLTKIVPIAALETALERFPAPKWSRSRSLSAENAYGLVVMSIVVPSIGIVEGTLPFSTRVFVMIKARSKVAKFITSPTFERFLGILFKPFKLTVLRIIGMAWHLIAITLNFAAAFIGLLILSAFVVNGESDLLELCFPQTAPRKRHHLENGELILRREPGGSKP